MSAFFNRSFAAVRVSGFLVFLLCSPLLLAQRAEDEVQVYRTKSTALPADQPFASYWFPNSLLSWSPASDPDAPYNRSNIPLRSRFLNPNTQVNSHARAGEGQVNNLSIFWATSGNPSQGALDINYNAYNYWQYLDLLVFWGGSAGEGLILAPNPGILDAAHRNGVEVLGTVFFPPVVFGGQIQWVQDMLQRSGSSFPVADKMIEVAEYYGFDGWFINQETSGGNSLLAADMRDFMIYMQRNSDLRIEWYDAMTESGSISWQEQLNSNNDMFFQYADTLVSEYMFLDFGWTTTDLTTSRTNAHNLNRSEYQLFAGIDVQANGYNTAANWNAVFPENQPHNGSVAFYVPSWVYYSSSGLSDFYTRANRFWVGANRNPANTTTSGSWKGLAHYVPAKSPLNQLPFVSNFNTGQGYDYYIDGQRLSPDEWSSSGWNNMSLQDVLPTWRWVISGSGALLYPEMDWTDAYYGGNSVRVSGDLSANNSLKLFKTKLAITPATRLELAYKTTAGPTHLRIGLLFEDSPLFVEYIPVGSAPSSDWEIFSVDMGPQSGRTLAEISLFFEAGGGSNYRLNIGRVAVFESPVDAPVAPDGLFVEKKVEESVEEATLRLRWLPSGDEVYYYNIYRRNPDNSRTYLGGTANTAYFVPSVRRVGNEASVIIEVEAISNEFGSSPAATTSFTWDASQPPGSATNPVPTDGETDVSTVPTLVWSAGAGATSHNVYFGNSNPPAFAGNRTDLTFNPGLLQTTTQYFWRIDEVNAVATTTGSVWSFTTGEMLADTSGYALGFDGVDDYVNLGNTPALQLSGSQLTIEARILVNQFKPAVWAGSVLVKDQAGDRGYMLRCGGNGQLNINIGNGSWNELTSPAAVLQAQIWTHIAGTYDGTRFHLYVNGNEVAQSNPVSITMANITAGNLLIGESPQFPGRVFDGQIDEVRLWTRARSEQQLRSSMNGKLDSVYFASADSGLAGYWSLDEGSGQITADKSINGSNGILGNSNNPDTRDPVWVSRNPGVGVEEIPAIMPVRFNLQQNYPNPFNPATAIQYDLPQAEEVLLSIYTILGQPVRTLVQERQAAGSYRAIWDGRNSSGLAVGSGIYLYRLRAGGQMLSRKMLLIR